MTRSVRDSLRMDVLLCGLWRRHVVELEHDSGDAREFVQSIVAQVERCTHLPTGLPSMAKSRKTRGATIMNVVKMQRVQWHKVLA